MANWVVWLVVSGALLLAEVLTLTFVLGLLSLAAGLTTIAAVLDVPVAGQIAVFGVSSAALFVLVKPLERRHQRGPAIRTGTAALTGRSAVVTEEVSEHGGRVKLGGESWAARPLSPGLTLAVGTSVGVAKVNGATLVVFPEEL